MIYIITGLKVYYYDIKRSAIERNEKPHNEAAAAGEAKVRPG